MIHSRRHDNDDNFDTIQSQGIGIDGELVLNAIHKYAFKLNRRLTPIHQAAIVNVEPWKPFQYLHCIVRLVQILTLAADTTRFSNFCDNNSKPLKWEESMYRFLTRLAFCLADANTCYAHLWEVNAFVRWCTVWKAARRILGLCELDGGKAMHAQQLKCDATSEMLYWSGIVASFSFLLSFLTGRSGKTECLVVREVIGSNPSLRV